MHTPTFHQDFLQLNFQQVGLCPPYAQHQGFSNCIIQNYRLWYIHVFNYTKFPQIVIKPIYGVPFVPKLPKIT